MCAPRRSPRRTPRSPPRAATRACIAGGQTLVPMLSMRMARPKVLVDIMRSRELGDDRGRSDAIRVGAARAAGRAAGLAGTRRAPAAARAGACPGSATRRPAPRHGVRLGRARRSERGDCRWCWSRSAATSYCRRKRDGGSVAADDFFTGLMSTARARRRNDRGGALSPARARRTATRSASSRAGTAISPSSPARPSRRGRRAARGRRRRATGRPRVNWPLRTALRSTTRSTNSPASSTRATTCTPPRDYRRDLVRRLGRADDRGGAAMPRLSAARAPPDPPRAQRPRRSRATPSRACC